MNYIVSYPKCGRTWLRVMIGKYCCDLNGCKDILATKSISGIRFTHLGSTPRENIHYNQFDIPSRRLKNKRILLLMRNVFDVVTSFYYHMKYRAKHPYKKSIHKFIRDPRYGIRKIIRFHNVIFNKKALPEKFDIIRYEDMHKSTSDVLQYVLSFFRIEINKEYIKKAVEFSRFEHMQKLEREGYFNNDIFNPSDINNTQTYKCRKGIVNGYKKELSEKDISYIDLMLQKHKKDGREI